MKKRGGHEGRSAKGHHHHHPQQQQQQQGTNSGNEKPGTGQEVVDDEDSHNQGFGEWLRSSDGVEMMRLFVIANSVLIIVTMAWPNMKVAYQLVMEMISGEDE